MSACARDADPERRNVPHVAVLRRGGQPGDGGCVQARARGSAG